MKYSRHADHHEIQPVPRITEECKRSNTEPSRQNFHRRLERIDTCEHVPAHSFSIKTFITIGVHLLLTDFVTTLFYPVRSWMNVLKTKFSLLPVFRTFCQMFIWSNEVQLYTFCTLFIFIQINQNY